MTNLCVCPPFKKSFTSGETPGPGLWRLYISIHNWWPGPRQTAHYTCNMDSLLVSDACPRLDLTLSHHCVWSWNGEGMAYVYGRLATCARVFTCVCVIWLLQPKNIIDRPCVHQNKFGSCCDCWFQVWLSKFLFLELFLWLPTSCLFCFTLTLVPVHLWDKHKLRGCYLCRFLETNWSGIQALVCLLGLTLLFQFQWRFTC